MSETERHRKRFVKYTKGMGLDLGFGGDPINDTAICVDLPEPYGTPGDKPQHLTGDATNLYWFKDNVFDYVYSSHLIEDFDDTQIVLKEWLRVIKPGGYLCLLFPDEKVYKSKTPKKYWNLAHKHLDFGMSYMLNVFDKMEYIPIESHEFFEGGDYNCMIVVKK